MCEKLSQVRHWRERNGLTQKDLALRLGWPRQKISRLEVHPHTAGIEDLMQLAWALQVPAVALYPFLAATPPRWEDHADAVAE